MDDTRPKRPTLQTIQAYPTHICYTAYPTAEVDAWNTYRDGLLRETLGALERSHYRETAVNREVEQRHHDGSHIGVCGICRFIAKIRTALEEDV